MVKAGWPGRDFKVKFYSSIEFVEGLLKQAVNQWTEWMEKKTPDIMYCFKHVLSYCQTPGLCRFITKETWADYHNITVTVRQT